MDLKQQWDELKKEQPHLRIKNAADQLGVSEMELLATQIGTTVTRLTPTFKEILLEIEALGKVMALTRNEECVHERKGVYTGADFSSPHVGLFVGEDIDLRMFMTHWKKVFAVEDHTVRGTNRSIQFFGADGKAIHKIYLTPDSDLDAYVRLVEKYKDANQEALETAEQQPLNLDEKRDDEIDVESFRKDWEALKDTHDFFMMLKKHGVSRTQALRLAPSDYFAKRIANEKIVEMLELAAKTNTPIMVFVGNKGNIQIHTGPIKKTLWHGGWYNIMDPDFNMHLDMSKIAQTWVVRKPTEDGIVTAIEVFNELGDIIVQFFGKRKPGVSELTEWQEIIKEIEA